MTLAGNSFIGLDDVNFAATSLVGSNLQVGVKDTGGVSRLPVFTLSPGVRAVIYGVSPGTPGGGDVTAYVYHINGTYDSANSPHYRRHFYFSINEMTSLITAPTL
ncbi:MAG: hypothetical protein P1P89_12500 [Desulfobacterales bacterium]|nr:hypothetical protein [Desulfobacterales bacterium]